MDIQHLKAELNHHKMEWNQLGSHFDKAEEKILDCIRTGDRDLSLQHFEILKDLESRMRPIRNNIIFVYENLAQFYRLKGNSFEENEFIQKAALFHKSRLTRNDRSLKLVCLLNRNGIAIG